MLPSLLWSNWMSHCNPAEYVWNCLRLSLTLAKLDIEFFLQIFLDLNMITLVISLVQEYGKGVLEHLFKMSCTLCYSLYSRDLELLASGMFTSNMYILILGHRLGFKKYLEQIMGFRHCTPYCKLCIVTFLIGTA